MATTLLLRNRLAPGDVLMLTAAVRDLHRAHPGAYRTAVDTSCPPLWENNPLVTALAPGEVPDRVIDCEYPLIHQADRRPFHFIHGFVQDLEAKLGVPIPAGSFRGDLYLSAEEMRRPSPAAEAGHEGPYWVLVAGGKYDFTAKWWDPDAYQAVVDAFRGRIRFVRCGAPDDWHPPLRDVVDLVGWTGVRELIRLIHHADGVICPVTFAMHLAAAVPTRAGAPPLRPCVVVAGGREPAHWEMYPGHQFLHTVGALDCCAAGGAGRVVASPSATMIRPTPTCACGPWRRAAGC
jgi:ADP-heptose:LPS heptosyltransferase